MKSYTNIEQSKVLAEILPFKSADMFYLKIPNSSSVGYNYSDLPYFATLGMKDNLPAWSLAALLEIIPKDIEGLNRLRIDIDNVDFSIWYDDLKGYGVNDKLPDITLKEPVDACVEMIVKLKEKGIL